MTNAPGIDLRNVSVSRGGRAILNDVNMTVAGAGLVAIVGFNGAGKTTLLSLLATLATPHSGRIFVDGIDAVAMPDQVRSRIGVVFQESALEPRLSAYDNLSFIARCQGLKGRSVRQRIDELVTAFGLEALAAAPVHCLSGGQRRRLELARALISRPPVLLLDEPTLGLDVAARHVFWAEIRTLVGAGHTVLCSTHHADEASDADRVVVLHQGGVLADGPWRELCAHVPGTIRLQVPDIETAHRWLWAQGYAATIDEHGIAVPVADPQAALPGLLQRMPCRVSSVDVTAPNLMDVVDHWNDARENEPCHLAEKAAA
ncbi:heme ABC exporter ATP-binding protein CcmA [Paraburkholderia nodosa]|uniref:heme ABC exporter ATP-binding protein CcmA n=1 Tax=Paraburkholderia nodosa TaxID=392320 RepID=UPI0004B960BF|nr:heme ABC exporter ATP-binding protein CcmA [Paraburkholderia nodosa]